MTDTSIVEQVRTSEELGWFLSWPEASHTSFLVLAGSTKRWLGGLIETVRPDIDAIARVFQLLWKASTEPAARALVRTYEPTTKVLRDLAPSGWETLEHKGLEAHLFDIDSDQTLERACRALWHDASDFMVLWGDTGQTVELEALVAPDRSLALKGEGSMAAGKYQDHSECMAVVVAKEPGRGWRLALERAVAPDSATGS